MLGRIIVAGIVGGAVLFAWGAFLHLATPIGGMGIGSLPSEGMIVPTLQAGIREDGLYMFPPMDEPMTPESEKAWQAKYEAGPRGLVLYHAGGGEMMSVRQLGTELGANVLAGVIAAAVVLAVGGSMMRRVAVCVGMGLFAWLNIDVSYWNWYGFPLEMITGSLIDKAVGWLPAGVAIAWIVGRGGPRAGAEN